MSRGARRVEVVGGGPAGLYAARLLQLRDPSTSVVVHERMRGDDETFGFGVGLTESTMRNLDAADPETAAAIRSAAFAGHTLALRGGHGSTTLHGARNVAIGRAALLDVLRDAAVDAGVDYRAGSRPDAASLDADVVIAADGVGSATRGAQGDRFGVRRSLGRTRFVWCGADFAVDAAFFAARRHGDELYVVHAYPYAPDRSTFLVEIDERTWLEGGYAELDAQVEDGASDEASVARLSRIFAEELGGRPLLTNRTRWSRFTELRLDRWSSGNVALVGDAAHTAHYTLGSGTKLALEDAIALADALTTEDDRDRAFAIYERTRRPAVERFKQLAGRSQRWWDSFRLRVDGSPDAIALSYMTRSGNLGIGAYAADQPEVVRRALSGLDGTAPRTFDDIDDWVLERPLASPALRLPDREPTQEDLDAIDHVRLHWSTPDVWGPEADGLVADLGAGTTPVLLVGPDDDVAVGARIDLAERLGFERQRTVLVALPASARSQGAAAVAAGRCAAILVEAGDRVEAVAAP